MAMIDYKYIIVEDYPLGQSGDEIFPTWLDFGIPIVLGGLHIHITETYDWGANGRGWVIIALAHTTFIDWYGPGLHFGPSGNELRTLAGDHHFIAYAGSPARYWGVTYWAGIANPTAGKMSLWFEPHTRLFDQDHHT
jgi:hypothetical protein